ncbi:complex I NDUFA9 subunit family protein [Roseovarius sp. E0-M6]|uniref:complex I NDUFA9 subunit family protein n=1 Tax=Roseovarius sp. E0-M6 TaxID=3127118 RepID=UPI00300FFF45
MSKIATVYGGSGFVGRYIVRRLANLGWRVRVAVRRPNEAMHVTPYGVVGQIAPVLCNIRNDDSVRAALHGVDVVINCVGTFDAGGKNNFEAVQDKGAERVARLAAEEGVANMVQISAIGADKESDSIYAQTKAQGEEAVLEHFPNAVILRPSVIFGPEDEFFNRFAGMARMSPILPLVGADTKFQPVYVDDVAAAAVAGATGNAAPGIYELGGPDVNTFRDLMKYMLEVIRRRRMLVNMPFFVARPMATLIWLGNFLTLGLAPMPITRDQVASLQYDNVVSEGARGFDDLGIEPKSMKAILPDYLWRFRSSGQYAAIKESARNLRA